MEDCVLANARDDPEAVVKKTWGEIFESFGDNCIPPHSTSWRHDRAKECNIFTYIFYSESLDFSKNNASVVPFNRLKFPHEFDGEISWQECAKAENVLGHAIRHLALLVKFNKEFYKDKLSSASFRLLNEKRVLGPAGRLC